MNRENKKIRTRKSLIKTATKEFARKGYARTNINEISLKAGYGKGTVYNYFKDKFNIETDVFCYPFGKVNQNVYDLTKKIYKNAVTTNRSRYNINKHNPFKVK